MTSPPDAPPAIAVSRRAYIDWARGLAVLLMIHAHVLDAWTLASERARPAFAILNFIGGLAAPLFLWLAGLAMVLSAERALLTTGSRVDTGVRLFRRGAEVFALAFLFRLQAFVVSPGNPVLSLLRVDILNIMGPSLMLAALIWLVARSTRGAAIAMALVATALALATPPIRAASWVQSLPAVVQWYVTPAGNHSTFVMFPWAGFVFAGAACGALIALAGRKAERKAVAGIGLAGAAMIVLCLYASTLPSPYANASFWTTSPAYFGVRAGIQMLVLALAMGAATMAVRLPAPFAVLERFGRSSLFVYWIHVELVYGYTTRLIHRTLPLWGTALAFVLFTAVMYFAIAGRDRLVAWWQTRTPRRHTPEVARA